MRTGAWQARGTHESRIRITSTERKDMSVDITAPSSLTATAGLAPSTNHDDECATPPRSHEWSNAPPLVPYGWSELRARCSPLNPCDTSAHERAVRQTVCGEGRRWRWHQKIRTQKRRRNNSSTAVCSLPTRCHRSCDHLLIVTRSLQMAASQTSISLGELFDFFDQVWRIAITAVPSALNKNPIICRTKMGLSHWMS